MARTARIPTISRRLPSALAIVALPCPGPCQGRPQVGVRRQVARFAADLLKALLDLEGGQLAGSDQRLQGLRQVEGGPRGKRGEGTGCEDAHPVVDVLVGAR